MPRGGRRLSAALWGVLYHGPNPQATADFQCPLVINWCVVIPIQLVPNAAVSLVRAFPVDLLHPPGDVLVLGSTDSGFPGAPLIVSGPGNMQRTACCAYGKAFLFRAPAHRFVLLFLPELPQRSPFSGTFTFFADTAPFSVIHSPALTGRSRSAAPPPLSDASDSPVAGRGDPPALPPSVPNTFSPNPAGSGLPPDMPAPHPQTTARHPNRPAPPEAVP